MVNKLNDPDLEKIKEILSKNSSALSKAALKELGLLDTVEILSDTQEQNISIQSGQTNDSNQNAQGKQINPVDPFRNINPFASSLEKVKNIQKQVDDAIMEANPYQSKHPIVKDKIKKTNDLVLAPIKITFAREILNYVDSISTQERLTKIVFNTIDTPYSALNEDGELEIRDDKRINPEWLTLINNGYVPPENNPKFENLFPFGLPPKTTAESNYTTDENGNFVTLSASNQVVVTRFAGAFKNSLNDMKADVSIADSETKVKISGKLNVGDINKSIKVTSIPKIDVNYEEMGNKINLKSSISGSIFSNTYGLVPYYSSFEYSTKAQDGLTNEIKQRLTELETNNCEPTGKSEIFSLLLYNKIRPFLVMKSGEDLSGEVLKKYGPKFKKIVSSFSENLSKNFAKNRLLQKIPQVSYDYQKLLNKTNDDNNLILLNLINFAPESTEEQKKCGKNIHPLNLDLIQDLMSKKFADSAQKQTELRKQNRLDEADKINPMIDAGNLCVLLLTIRLTCFEYVLRTLFVLDEIKYHSKFVDDPMIVDYVSSLALIDIAKIGIFDETMKAFLDNYQFLKKNNIVTTNDESVDDPSTASKFTETASNINNNKNIEIDSLNKEFKALVKVMLRRTIKYAQKIIGFSEENSNSPDDFFLNSLKICEPYYDSPSADYIKNNSRFRNIDIESIPFIIEKYTVLPKSKNKILSEYMIKNNLNGVTTFANFTKFFKELSTGKIKGINKNTKFKDIFSEIPKYGMRICYVEKSSTNKNNIFTVNKIEKQIKNNILIEDKINNFYEIDEATNTKTTFNGFILFKKENNFNLDLNDSIQTLSTESILNRTYFSNKKSILNSIKSDIDYKILFETCLMSNKIPGIFSMYSYNAMMTEKNKVLFNGTRRNIYKLSKKFKNFGNYAEQKEDDSVSILQKEMNNFGNPNGSLNLDLIQFLITTPVLILKGLTQLMDPNIAIASQIVNAAAAGLLFPKLDEEGNVAGYPGDPITLPTVLASLMLLPINLMPPGIGIGPPVTPLPGMLYWALEPLLWKLPFFQNQISNPNSDIARAAKKEYGLSPGAQNFSCDEDQDM